MSGKWIRLVECLKDRKRRCFYRISWCSFQWKDAIPDAKAPDEALKLRSNPSGISWIMCSKLKKCISKETKGKELREYPLLEESSRTWSHTSTETVTISVLWCSFFQPYTTIFFHLLGSTFVYYIPRLHQKVMWRYMWKLKSILSSLSPPWGISFSPGQVSKRFIRNIQQRFTKIYQPFLTSWISFYDEKTDLVDAIYHDLSKVF